MKNYSVEMEVAGPLAMFSRPDTGGTPTSYPVPTWSAAKGMVECIALLSGGEAWFHPTRVEVCRPKDAEGSGITFQRYTTNYGGPLRKDLNVKSGTGMQIFATVLSNVCYRIHAEVRGPRESPGRNPRHHLQDLFERRLKQGRCFRTPALGWSEFTCDYWGVFRPEWEVDEALSIELPSMLATVWDSSHGGVYESVFLRDVRIKAGSLTYDQTPWVPYL